MISMAHLHQHLCSTAVGFFSSFPRSIGAGSVRRGGKLVHGDSVSGTGYSTLITASIQVSEASSLQAGLCTSLFLSLVFPSQGLVTPVPFWPLLSHWPLFHWTYCEGSFFLRDKRTLYAWVPLPTTIGSRKLCTLHFQGEKVPSPQSGDFCCW